MTSRGFMTSVQMAPCPPLRKEPFSPEARLAVRQKPHPPLQCRQSQKWCPGRHTPRPQEGRGGTPPSAPSPAASRQQPVDKGVTGTCPADADTIVISLVTARKGTEGAAIVGMPGGQLHQQALLTPQGTGQDADTCLVRLGVQRAGAGCPSLLGTEVVGQHGRGHCRA